MVKRISVPTALAGLHLDTDRAARWTTALLVVALGLSLAQLTWLLLPAPMTSAAPAPLAAPKTPIAGGVAARLETVATLHLFGQPAATPQPAAQVNAPETSLNLTLRGLFAAARKETAFAIIAEGSGTERHYRIGDGVAGGAVVHDILADRVVLERAGRYETLRLPKERLQTAAPPPPPARGGAVVAPGVTGQLQELRESLKSNPQEIMAMAEVQPVVQDGQLRGYRIRPRKHMELFRAAGLTPNDVVTAVNGVPVTDPAQFAALTAQLSSASSLRLSVERPDGAVEEIVVELN